MSFIIRVYFILSFDYHSIGVYRLGNDLVKLKLVPKNTTTKIDEKRIDYSIEDYLKDNNYELELMVQYCYDLEKQPVNQLNKMWKNSDFVSIGTIKISEVIDKNNKWVEVYHSTLLKVLKSYSLWEGFRNYAMKHIKHLL